MTQPKVADTKPMKVDLEPGEHYWCSCGESEGQPFCDGSHRGTSFKPLAFKIEDAKSAAMCLCKQTANAPYCDGAHAKLKKKKDAPAKSPTEANGAWHKVAETDQLADGQSIVAKASGRLIALTRVGNTYGAIDNVCPHMGGPLGDGTMDANGFLRCPWHGWGFHPVTGESHKGAAGNSVTSFPVEVRDDGIYVQVDESAAVPAKSVVPPPQNTPQEPTVEFIHALARDGLEKIGHDGPMGAMGVPGPTLPRWDDIQILAAQMATKPLMENVAVATELVIGPNAKKPPCLKIPLFVTDMSFGALSEEAKIALARGAEGAGTGICSGEGGMLPDEQAANSRYFYELASAKFGYREELLERVQAFHFKGGQGAKTGTGGHLPGTKVTGKIAKVRGLKEGEAAISPPTFADLASADDFRRFGDRVRKVTGGIPIGFKLSANHIEGDMAFALEAGADYIILDGRGGGTGAAPLIFRDNISVPTIPALARARRFLDQQGRGDVTLIITGGIRTPADFIKALCLGADGIAVANSAMQAIGCIAARICNTNQCPAGIATQREDLRARLNVDEAAARLTRFFNASTQLMQVMARACGHANLGEFNQNDITTWKKEMADLTGIKFAGIGST